MPLALVANIISLSLKEDLLPDAKFFCVGTRRCRLSAALCA